MSYFFAPLIFKSWVDFQPYWHKNYFTEFENRRKSLIRHCERSELHLHFEWSNSVTRQVNFNRTKNCWKCQNSKIQMRHFELFSNIVYSTIPNMKEYRSALIWLAFTGRVRLHVISMLEVDVLGIRKHVACINIQSQRKLMWASESRPTIHYGSLTAKYHS